MQNLRNGVGSQGPRAVGIVDKFQQAEVRNGRVIFAEASGVGDGTDGTMTLFKDFHDFKNTPDVFFDATTLTKAEVDKYMTQFGAPTAEEYRALIVLHELAHLTGWLSGHEKVLGYSHAFYELVLFKICARNQRFDPAAHE